jgi:hypothetical protein
MAARRNNLNSDAQLDLFSNQRPTHESIDTIRPDGRETLARTLPENGARLEAKGQLHAMLLEAEEKTKDEMIELTQSSENRDDGAAGPRPAWEMVREKYILLPPRPSRGHQRPSEDRADSPKNLNSYRITDADRLGEGGPKQKFSQNLKAIEIAAGAGCRGTSGFTGRKSHAGQICRLGRDAPGV